MRVKRGSETRRKMSSIARRLNFSWAMKLFTILLCVNVVLVLILAHRFYGAEVGIEEGRLILSLGDVSYYDLFYLLRPLAVVEAVLWLGTLLFGTGAVRRRLRPLDDLAETARRLTNVRPDEGKFHDLEDAISRIRAPDARLRTGDRDLQSLEEAVNGLLDRMEENYRQQSRFVSDASHELRTPIAVIQGYANMLDRWGKQDEKILAESIAAIKSEAEQMNRLVEQLLFLARGDSGRTPLRAEELDLSALMGEVYEEYRMIDEAHEWRLETPGAPVTVRGDAGLLKQCARVLADNAVKYTPEGGVIRLRVRTEDGAPAFEVQDAGIGIPQKDAEHIFERFFRSDPARSRQSGGAGLGLSIARWIVDRHGGYFKVLSREGIGTRMTVVLPGPPAQDRV
ncbi:MAG TPA: ATP-binding protein [Oscillospiraceae bacterium]|nr:ATP-binding protein [Oscillospiraceae bacterium]